MTPGRIFCLRGERMKAKPPLLPVSLLSSSFGAQRGERRHREAVLFIHALADSWLQLAEDGTEEEGDCGQDRGESRREVLNQGGKRGTSEALHVIESADTGHFTQSVLT